MIGKGVDTFIEIGPGKTLSGFIRKTDRSVKTLNIEDLASLENTLNELT
jgi:[acyl-carrier-protein] S-malonyltransferase